MSGQLSLKGRIQALSPRERGMIAFALMLLLVLGIVYGVLMPGQASARSAGDRSIEAAKDLAASRALAASITAAPTEQIDTAGLRQAAEGAGLVVIEATSGPGSMQLRLRGPAPAPVLAWLAGASKHAAVNSVVIDADPSGGVTAHVILGTDAS